MEREPNLEYFDLAQRLEKRFSTSDLPSTLRMQQFMNLRQKTDESIYEWADRVASLGTKAYIEMPENLIQYELVLKFCQGCMDRESGHYAINMKPQTLDQAIGHVVWNRNTTEMMNAGRVRYPNRQMHADTEASEECSVEAEVMKVNKQKPQDTSNKENTPDLERRVSPLEGKMNEVLTVLEQLKG